MRAKSIILGVGFFLPLGLIYFVLNQDKPVSSAATRVAKNENRSDTNSPTSKKTPFITTRDLYMARLDHPSLAPITNTPVKLLKKKGLIDSAIDSIDPESLKKYEGSYTITEFRNKESDEPITLNSSWILWNSKLPHVGASIRKNDQTGEYEFVGASLFLPTKGLGVSYERDKKTDEIRAYLNFKKSF